MRVPNRKNYIDDPDKASDMLVVQILNPIVTIYWPNAQLYVAIRAIYLYKITILGMSEFRKNIL